MPWSTRLGAAAVAFIAVHVAGFGLLLLGLWGLGSGFTSGPDPGAHVEPLSIASGLGGGALVLVLGCGLGLVALAVLRGALVPSVIAWCVAPPLAVLGIGRLLAATSVGLHERLTGAGVPLVLLVSLAAPGHRRYVRLRRAHRAAGTTTSAVGPAGAPVPGS